MIFILFFLSFIAKSQPPPFWQEIKEFKKQDSISSPPAGAILFVGSSSFRYWKNIHDDFREHTILNRGFGGSSLVDVIRYAEDIIFKYEPRQIVIYCGENDLTESDITAAIVFERFIKLFTLIRNRYPDISIVYISIKPSPSRSHLMPLFDETNRCIRNFLKSKPNASFVDVYKKMLTRNRTPNDELFLDDRLHMNEKGYAIWKKSLEPFLLTSNNKKK